MVAFYHSNAMSIETYTLTPSVSFSHYYYTDGSAPIGIMAVAFTVAGPNFSYPLSRRRGAKD